MFSPATPRTLPRVRPRPRLQGNRFGGAGKVSVERFSFTTRLRAPPGGKAGQTSDDHGTVTLVR